MSLTSNHHFSMHTTDMVPKLRFPGFYEMPIFVQMNKIFPSIRNGFVGTATPYYTDNGIKYLQGKNIKNNKIDPSGMIFISKEFHEKQKKSILRLGDIVMVQSGHVGECACITKDYEGSNCHALLVLSSDKGIHSMYYTYYFYTEYGKKNIYKITTGNTIKHILSSDLKILDVPYVNIKEQQKIASFLSSVDEKISHLEKKKTLLETYKKGIMQKIFSQELRFKDENGQEFPEWEEKTLGSVCKKTSLSLQASEIENKRGIYKVYGASGVVGKINTYQFDHPYIAIVKDGSGVGNLHLCQQMSSAIGTMDAILSKDNHDLFFVYLLLSRINFRKYKVGSSIPHIYFRDYHIEKCMIPSLDEQRKISSFIRLVDKKIEITSTQLEKTREFKKGLLQQMFV